MTVAGWLFWLLTLAVVVSFFVWLLLVIVSRGCHYHQCARHGIDSITTAKVCFSCVRIHSNFHVLEIWIPHACEVHLCDSIRPNSIPDISNSWIEVVLFFWSHDYFVFWNNNIKDTNLYSKSNVTVGVIIYII